MNPYSTTELTNEMKSRRILAAVTVALLDCHAVLQPSHASCMPLTLPLLARMENTP